MDDVDGSAQGGQPLELATCTLSCTRAIAALVSETL